MNRTSAVLTLCLTLVAAGAALCASVSKDAGAGPPGRQDEPTPEEGGSEGAEPVPVIGNIIWPGHDLSHAQVRAYLDPRHSVTAGVAHARGASGGFALVLDPGTYWLVAFADDNANGVMDAGDGTGFFGTTDIMRQKAPTPLYVDQDAVPVALALSITLTHQADKSLKPIAARAVPPLPAGTVAIGGRCDPPEEAGPPVYILLQGLGPRASSAAALCDANGEFSVEFAPGGHLLAAVQDRNSSGRIDEGDLIGVHGYIPEEKRVRPFRLDASGQLPRVSLSLSWQLAAEGRLRRATDDAPGPRLQMGALPAIVSGVVRDGEAPDAPPASGATVTFFSDSSLSEPIAQLRCDDQGRFVAALQAASYCIGATYDVDGDDRLGEGDRAGFYGVRGSDQLEPPPPLSLIPGEIVQDVPIRLVMTLPPPHSADTPPSCDTGDGP